MKKFTGDIAVYKLNSSNGTRPKNIIGRQLTKFNIFPEKLNTPFADSTKFDTKIDFVSSYAKSFITPRILDAIIHQDEIWLITKGELEMVFTRRNFQNKIIEERRFILSNPEAIEGGKFYKSADGRIKFACLEKRKNSSSIGIIDL